MYDHAKFFAGIRSLAPHFSQTQVDGFNAVLDAAPPDMAACHLAYCLATAWHETAFTMKPIEEYGRGRGKAYGPSGFWGRGYVQLTWKDNYAKAGNELGVDLVRSPALAMRPEIAAKIMFDGMREGWFTGKKLSDYFSATVDDPVNARRIINGTDRAAQVAGYHRVFLSALIAAASIPSSPTALPSARPQASDSVRPGFWTAFITAFATKSRKAPQ